MQTGTITPGQSGSGSNGNKEVLHTPQIIRTEASASAVTECHTQNTRTRERDVTNLNNEFLKEAISESQS